VSEGAREQVSESANWQASELANEADTADEATGRNGRAFVMRLLTFRLCAGERKSSAGEDAEVKRVRGART